MNKLNLTGRDIAVQALIATVYIVMTMLFMPLSFGFIQVRFSEFILILVLFSPKNALGLILGCFIVNFFGEFGIVDVIFGTLATALTCLAMIKTKHRMLSFVWPAIINGVIVGIELAFLLEMNPLITMSSVAIGEAFATLVPAFFLSKALLENRLLKQIFE